MSIISSKTNRRKNLLLKDQYELINDIVRNQGYSIENACNHLNIRKSKYYYICKKLSLKSITYILKNESMKNFFNVNSHNTSDENLNKIKIKKNKKINIMNTDKIDNMLDIMKSELKYK